MGKLMKAGVLGVRGRGQTAPGLAVTPGQVRALPRDSSQCGVGLCTVVLT